jgi:hypothetical protein
MMMVVVVEAEALDDVVQRGRSSSTVVYRIA